MDGLFQGSVPGGILVVMTTTTAEQHDPEPIQTDTQHVRVELLNIDGAVIGQAKIMLDRPMRQALGRTLGPGYEARLTLPPPPHADPRCPYSVRVVTVP